MNAAVHRCPRETERQMVSLTKIYTRTGDDGQTSLVDGSRVSKLDDRIVAGGSVDETNSCLGVAAGLCEEASLRDTIFTLQQQLFDLGADLSAPWPATEEMIHVPRISTRHVEWLESQIDDFNAALQPLKSFVLPGGSQFSAAFHVARSVCRRAEIDVLRLAGATQINPQIAVYLNRLSDLLFVLARHANRNGELDVLWEPGRNLPESE